MEFQTGHKEVRGGGCPEIQGSRRGRFYTLVFKAGLDKPQGYGFCGLWPAYNPEHFVMRISSLLFLLVGIPTTPFPSS